MDIVDLYKAVYTAKTAGADTGSGITARDLIVASLAGLGTYGGYKGYQYFKEKGNRNSFIRDIKKSARRSAEDIRDMLSDILA